VAPGLPDFRHDLIGQQQVGADPASRPPAALPAVPRTGVLTVRPSGAVGCWPHWRLAIGCNLSVASTTTRSGELGYFVEVMEISMRVMLVSLCHLSTRASSSCRP